jgi:hypothetical protein
MNVYLLWSLVFVVIIYLFYLFFKKSNFVPTNIPDVPDQPNLKPDSPLIPVLPSIPSENVHYEDTRYIFPLSPPVNPIVSKSILETKIEAPNYAPVDDLINTDYSLVDNKSISNTGTNELLYSGGTTALLKIPLQMNEPNSFEQLRSQDVLITPYNRIKYSNTIC